MLRAQNLSKSVPTDSGPQFILRDCNLELSQGGMTAIVGPSGAGKTSLLYCLSGLDQPDAGNVWINGVDIYGLNDERRSRFIRTTASFVFQQYNLIPYLTVEENIRLPLSFDKRKLDEGALQTTLDRFGLSDKRHGRVSHLSGGEQQRAALCRAILVQPQVVFADEPTGALDTANTSIVLSVLRELADGGCTVVLVTHDVESAALADRLIFMRDGNITNVTGKLGAKDILSQTTRLAGG